MNVRRRVVSVIGAAECTAEHAQAAEAVGRGLAQAGAVLVCGGRGGVMEAACRGAQQAGGLTIGILPGDNLADGNPYLSVTLPSGMGHARNTLVVLAGEVVIAIGGEAGTLSEIGLAVKSGRPVIGLDTWECRRADGGRLAIRQAESPQQAVEAALARVGLEDGQTDAR